MGERLEEGERGAGRGEQGVVAARAGVDEVAARGGGAHAVRLVHQEVDFSAAVFCPNRTPVRPGRQAHRIARMPISTAVAHKITGG